MAVWNFVPASAPAALSQRLGNAGNGDVLSSLFDGFGSDASQQAINILLSGLSTGMGPVAISGQLANVLDVLMSRALTIARTELLSSYRDAQLANYRANNDVVGQWMWMATKDGICCGACLAMDGQTFDLDTDMDSHPNCRCSPAPVTNSWSDILSPAGIDSSGLADTSITANYQTGVDWFNQQPAETQLDILGPSKFTAFENGDMTLSDLIDWSDDGEWGKTLFEKSLKQLGLK